MGAKTNIMMLNLGEDFTGPLGNMAEVQENPNTETVKARLDYVVTKMFEDFK